MQVWMEEESIQTEDERDARERHRVAVHQEAARFDRMMNDPDYLEAQADLPPHLR